jgi:NAD(P)H-hydrate epimerase
VTLPTVTAEQMREVDRIMVEDLGIDLGRMTENAGRGLAALAIRRDPQLATVTVLAGPGGNGAGGLVAARHLANRGRTVRVALGGAIDGSAPVVAAQIEVLRRIGVAFDDDPVGADLVVDALLGYSLRGDPRERIADLIEWTRAVDASVLSLDTPSGLDVTTGTPATPCVQADATMTVALPKAGLLLAPELVGELFLADISVPAAVYSRLGIEVPGKLFAESQVIHVQ